MDKPVFIGYRNATYWADNQALSYNNEEGVSDVDGCRAITGPEMHARTKWSRVDCNVGHKMTLGLR